MGVTESKMLVMKLSTACSNAEKNGDRQVSDVLSDKQVRLKLLRTFYMSNQKQFVDCLAKLWKHLPECSKIKIDPLGHKRSRKLLKRPNGQKIILSEDLKTNLDRWTNDPRSFFDESGSTDTSGLVSCPIAAFYEMLFEADSRNSRDTIRLRFLKVLFHHLKDRFCVTYLRPDAVEWISQKIQAAGLSDDTASISSRINGWAKVGAKYDALCRDLKGYNAAQDYRYLGNLFRLPGDVTDRL